MTALRNSISWFTLIGAIAALIHYLVALGSHHAFALSPAYANIMGFCFAFPVSYLGHRKLSFPDQTQSHQQAFPRFLSVALLGFVGNQALLLLLLRFTSAPFWLALGVVMVVIAVSTYLLSRHWAFAKK